MTTAAVLAVAVALAGCGSRAADSPSASAVAHVTIPRPPDGNCTYVGVRAASALLGRAVTARSADALAVEVDRCRYAGGAARLDYTVSYYGDEAAAARAFAAAGAVGASVALADASALSVGPAGSTLVFRYGPFLVTVLVRGSARMTDAVATSVGEVILERLG